MEKKIDSNKNNEIEKFLDDLNLRDNDKFKIVDRIRNEVKSIDPSVSECIKYGGVMFSEQGNDIGGIFVSKNHISIEFSSGYTMADPKGILEGTGKFRRHIKVKKYQDIEEFNLPFYLGQMLKTIS